MPAWNKKKYARLAKGYSGMNATSYKRNVWIVEKGLVRAYKDRKLKRRNLRRAWILHINGATREHGLPYNKLIFGLNRSNMQLDRKILSNLAINEPYSFKAVVDEVKIQARLGLLDQTVSPLSYYEALSQRSLVFGKVHPAVDENKQVLPIVRLRSDLDPKIAEQVIIDDTEHALEPSQEWLFKQK